jgi:hypothetical protein
MKALTITVAAIVMIAGGVAAEKPAPAESARPERPVQSVLPGRAAQPAQPSRAFHPLRERIGQIRMPDVQFREASLPDIIEFLAKETRELDPQKLGVNFVLMREPDPGRTITLQLRDVPLTELLRYLSELSGLAYRVERSAVVFAPPGQFAEEGMVMRVYPVSGAILQERMELQAAPGALRGPDDFR